MTPMDFCNLLSRRLNYGASDLRFEVEGLTSENNPEWVELFGYIQITVRPLLDSINDVEKHVHSSYVGILSELGCRVWGGHVMIAELPNGEFVAIHLRVRGMKNWERFEVSRLSDQIEQIEVQENGELRTSGTALNGDKFVQSFSPVNGEKLDDVVLRECLYESVFGPWPELVCPIPQLEVSCPGLTVIPFEHNYLGVENLCVTYGLAGKRAVNGVSQTVLFEKIDGDTRSTVSKLDVGPKSFSNLRYPGHGFELVAACAQAKEIAIAALQWGIHAQLEQDADIVFSILENGGLVLGPVRLWQGVETHFLITEPWGSIPKELNRGAQSIRLLVVVAISPEEAELAENLGIRSLLNPLRERLSEPVIELK